MRKPKSEKGETALEEKREERKGKGYAKGGVVGGSETKGNEGDTVRERHEERTDPQVRQDPREGERRGENVNFYENMIHHGEGGMLAPGEAPLTVGGAGGSKAPKKERPKETGGDA